jgi:hypothetical protein
MITNYKNNSTCRYPMYKNHTFRNGSIIMRKSSEKLFWCFEENKVAF